MNPRSFTTDGEHLTKVPKPSEVSLEPERDARGQVAPGPMKLVVKSGDIVVPARYANPFLEVVKQKLTPEKLGSVLESMIEKAEAGDTKAAALLLKYGIGDRDVSDGERVVL